VLAEVTYAKAVPIEVTSVLAGTLSPVMDMPTAALTNCAEPDTVPEFGTERVIVVPDIAVTNAPAPIPAPCTPAPVGQMNTDCPITIPELVATVIVYKPLEPVATTLGPESPPPTTLSEEPNGKLSKEVKKDNGVIDTTRAPDAIPVPVRLDPITHG
jgi:hypothetical protein